MYEELKADFETPLTSEGGAEDRWPSMDEGERSEVYEELKADFETPLIPEQARLEQIAEWVGMEPVEPYFTNNFSVMYGTWNSARMKISYSSMYKQFFFNVQHDEASDAWSVYLDEDYDPGMSLEAFLHLADRYFMVFPGEISSVGPSIPAEEIVKWGANPNVAESRLQTYANLAGLQDVKQNGNYIEGIFPKENTTVFIEYDPRIRELKVAFDGLGSFGFSAEGFDPGMTFEEFLGVAYDYFEEMNGRDFGDGEAGVTARAKVMQCNASQILEWDREQE